MKKLLLLLFLMTISLGYSQTLRLGFESGESGNAFGPFGDFAIQPVEAGTGSNTSLVLPIIANPSGQIWQGTNFTLTSPVELIATKTMTIDVLSSTPVTFLMKVNGGVAGAPAAAAQASHNGDGTWQTISFTFNTALDGQAATANGVYNNMVLHPFFPFSGSASARTFYIDNISGPAVTPPASSCTNGIQDGNETGVDCGGSCSPCPPFTVAAPTPTKAAEDVISVFSNAYTDIAGTDFFPNWGQSTQYAQFSPVVGNPTLKYSNLNYQGNQFSAPIDASAMQNLHIDIWTPDCTSFQVFLINQGIGEQGVTITPTLSGWNSFDIPLSSYTTVNKANIGQFKYVGNGTVYLDNIYFWKAPAGTFTYYADADSDGYGAGAAVLLTAETAPTGYSVNNTDCAPNDAAIYPGATEIADGLDNNCDGAIDEGFPPSTAAPTPPARNAWDVKSIFSGAYANVTLNELPTSWSQTAIAPFSVETIAGNATWKFGGEFLGMVTNYDSGVDLSQMTMMHIDYWTPDNKIIIAKIVNTIDGGEATTIVQDPVVTGTWRSVDIPMAQFGASLNKSKITQILLDPQLGGSTVYIDNFYFYRPETNQPSPTISNFTVPNKVIGDASFQLTPPTSNSTGAFTYEVTGASGVATISGDTVTIIGGGSTIITATQAAAGGYGPGSITASFVVSFPPPTTAAPTPTVPADRVLSIFSDAYTNEGGASYPYWGQPGTYIAPAIVPIGSPSSNTLKLDNLTYQGVQLATTIDVSSMTTLHLDIWTPNCTTFDFYLIDSAPVGVPPAEQKVSVSPTQTGWNSIDIPMSSYDLLALTAVQQFKFVGAPAGSIVYIDNIYFTKPTSRSIAPTTTAVVNYCKGAVATALTASGFSGNTLKWYTVGGTVSVPTYTLITTGAPTPATTTVASPSKKYAVSQVLSDGSESPKAAISVNVLALPTQVIGAITSNTESTVTAGTYLAATTAVGKFVGTSDTVSYRVPAFADTTLTYYWTVPTGVTIVSQDANVLTVNFLNVSAGAGTIGNITVQAQNANGCRTAAKTLAVSKVLPVAPTAIKMTDASLPVPTSGIPAAVTSFGQYMGTNKVLTLTATPSLTATSYVWELPEGVTQLSGGNSNIITVDFSGVTSSNTTNYTSSTGVSTNSLRIGVKASNGVGVSVTSNTALTNPTTQSTAKLLTLTATAPVAPTFKLTNDLVSTTTAVTVLSKFIGTNTEFTLTSAVATGASSYEWLLPQGVNVTSGNPETDRIIKVNFAGVGSGITSIYIGARSKNGIGTSNSSSLNAAAPAPYASSPYKLLKLTATVPAAVTTVSGQIGGVCGGSTYSYTITPSLLANSYSITAPTGSVVTSANDTTNNNDNTLITSDLTFSVTYPIGFVGHTTASPKTVAVASVNGVGSSTTSKVLNITTPMPAIGTATGSSGITSFSRCDTQSFVVPAVLGATTYVWSVANGAVIIDGQGTNAIEVDFSAVLNTVTSTKITVLATNACGVSTALKTITLASAACKSLKADAALVDNTISIYPNPARDIFTVALNASEVSEMSMTIYNINGAMIRTKNVQLTEGNNMINEDISSLASGIYFVQIYSSSNQETIVKKLVKE
jgi:hypothetical protein